MRTLVHMVGDVGRLECLQTRLRSHMVYAAVIAKKMLRKDSV